MVSPVETSRSTDLLTEMSQISDLVYYDWDVCAIGACAEKVNIFLRSIGMKPCDQASIKDGRLNIDIAKRNILQSKILVACWDGDPITLWQLGFVHGASSRMTMLHDERKLEDEMDRHFPVFMMDRIPIITFAQNDSIKTCPLIHDAVNIHFKDYNSLEDFLARYESILRKQSRFEISRIIAEDFRRKDQT